MHKQVSMVSMVIAAGLILVLATGIASAATVTQSITYQGKLTDAAGNPLSGDYSVTFKLYNVATGGTALATDTHNVKATGGLFTTTVTASQQLFDGRALWLGIKVGSDPEMTPRQEIRPVPYALGLRPGAVISGSGTTPALNVSNNAGIAIFSSGKEGGYFTTNQGGTVSNFLAAIHAVTSNDNNPGIIVKTSGDNDFGLLIDTNGDVAEGARILTHGPTSAGVNAVTLGSSSYGFRTVTNGDDSHGVYAAANGLNSKGVMGLSRYDVGVYGNGKEGGYFTTNQGGTDWNHLVPAVNVSTSFDFNPGILVNTTGSVRSHGIYVNTRGAESWGVIASTTGGASNAIIGSTKGGSSSGVAGITKGQASYGVVSQTHGPYSDGVNVHTWGSDSPAFDGITYGPNSYGADILTQGSDSTGVNVSTIGTNSTGVSVTTSSAYSTGLNVTTQGLSSPGIHVETSGTNSYGLVAATKKDFSTAVSARTQGKSTFGVDATTKGASSHAINANTYGPNSDGVRAFTSGPSSRGIRAETYGADSYGVHAITWQKSGGSNAVVGETYGNAAAVAGISHNTTASYSWGLYGVTDRPDNKYGVFTPDRMSALAYDTNAGDVAEYMPVSGDLSPGTVVVIGDEGILRESAAAYDTKVAGIISTDPGMALGTKEAGNPGEAQIAVAGRVPCKVDATKTPVHAGDLLATSDTPGYAMKATNPQVGTVLGKAMGTLESGTGTIEVLVTLQ